MYTRNKEIAEHHERQVQRAKSINKSNHSRFLVGKDSVTKIRAAATDSALNALGLLKTKPRDGYQDFPASLKMWELERKLQIARGETPHPHPGSVATRAMVDDDFGYIADDVFSKSLEAGYRESQETHRLFVDIRTCEDFRPFTAARIEAETPSRANHEISSGQFSDTGEVGQIETEGKIYSLTEKVLRDSSLTDMALVIKEAGDAMSRREGDLVYAVLTGNPTMADTNSLWDASNHGNHVTAGATPSSTTLNEAIALMRAQKLLTDTTKSANLVPKFLVVPTALEATAESLLRGMRDDHTLNPIICIPEGRLDTANADGWYLISAGFIGLYFLEGGEKGPRISTHPSWTTNALQVKVYNDFTAIPLDWRRGVYNDGVT